MAPACAPGASPFVERWFGDCLYDRRDALGFAAGLASIACWMVAQVGVLGRGGPGVALTRAAAAWRAEGGLAPRPAASTPHLTPPRPPPPPSIPCSRAPQLPQMVRNARTRSADALSPWFLAEWLLVRGLGGCGGAVQWPWRAVGRGGGRTRPPAGPRARAAAPPPPPPPPPPPQGDTCNLIGCLLAADQLATMTYTAM